MPYVYLFFSTFFSASIAVFATFYNRRNEGKKSISPLYNLLWCSCAFLFWLVMFLFDGTLDVSVIPYSLLFAAGFVLYTPSIMNALSCGSVALTSLVAQLSLVGVSIWGMIFWGDHPSALTFIGLALVAVSLFLCIGYEFLLPSAKRSGNRQKISLKWVIFASLTFLSNAICTIAQKTQQMHHDERYGNFLMMVALGTASLFCLIMFLRSDKRDAKVIFRRSFYLPMASGISNALLNLCVILMAASTLSPSLIYPTLAVGGIALTTLASAFIFKEKMHLLQWLGIAVGAVAMGVLSV